MHKICRIGICIYIFSSRIKYLFQVSAHIKVWQAIFVGNTEHRGPQAPSGYVPLFLSILNGTQLNVLSNQQNAIPHQMNVL